MGGASTQPERETEEEVLERKQTGEVVTQV